MKIETVNILRRLCEINGTAGVYRLKNGGDALFDEWANGDEGLDYGDPYGEDISFDSIEDAIHHEIDKLERNGIEPGTGRRIYLEGMER
tara:strand:+ start:229 stop:495 length:267 start_codon:yes stop_codon:yes gene_type:complete